jgi:hypothetical protein
LRLPKFRSRIPDASTLNDVCIRETARAYIRRAPGAAAGAGTFATSIRTSREGNQIEGDETRFPELADDEWHRVDALTVAHWEADFFYYQVYGPGTMNTCFLIDDATVTVQR